KMMALCFPGVSASVNQDGFCQFPNKSQVWFGGLDEKERIEKILGMEFATILFNECSQIPWSSVQIALTRLAQRCYVDAAGATRRQLALKAYYDENPPDKGHWTYRLFVLHTDPETRKPVNDPDNYAAMQINPVDNVDNLPPEYVAGLQELSARMQKRFYRGEFRDANPNALFPEGNIDQWRVTNGIVPEMVRIVVAVDPSGSGDEDNADNDAIGIAVCGLGTDGNGYLLEDLTVKAGPATWGKVATSAYERHEADKIVGETNFGGAMVRHVIETARPRTPYKEVRASRGKVARADPIASLCEQGKVRMVGYFPELEDELSGFTTAGYVGGGSPNRADAMIWGMTELFPGIVKEKRDDTPAKRFRPTPMSYPTFGEQSFG
ncbi:MAG TPA: phage terminase large subunit, partial [Candidatus Acidoferrales bacterium]|nr:phage terminase large subunit [Candidatus Acidoferrales bacterium]